MELIKLDIAFTQLRKRKKSLQNCLKYYSSVMTDLNAYRSDITVKKQTCEPSWLSLVEYLSSDFIAATFESAPFRIVDVQTPQKIFKTGRGGQDRQSDCRAKLQTRMGVTVGYGIAADDPSGKIRAVCVECRECHALQSFRLVDKMLRWKSASLQVESFFLKSNWG